MIAESDFNTVNIMRRLNSIVPSSVVEPLKKYREPEPLNLFRRSRSRAFLEGFRAGVGKRKL